MVKEKLAQQICNVLEKSYEILYHVVFLKVCMSNGVTPIGFNTKKTQCAGNPRKNVLLLWEKELAAAQFKLIELTISESVQILFDLETEFISKISLYTVQEDRLLKTKNHLAKNEKKLLLKKIKKIRMLASTDDLYFACLERFHY